MVKILISYSSQTGNTKVMAEKIREGIESAGSIEVLLKPVKDTTNQDMLDADGIIIGSPTYFGTLTAETKELIDKSIKNFGKLKGKVGGAFASSGGIAGGNETTILTILQGLLVHGMVIQGLQHGSHYGPVSVGAPEESNIKECIRYGKQMGELTLKLFG